MPRPPRAGPETVCLGDAMTDIGAALSAPLATGSDTPAAIVVRQGGSAANTAAWLTHLGAAAGLIARVGADPYGAAAASDLEARGVRSYLTVDRDAMTGVCIVLVGPDGERTMVPDSGANFRLLPADVPVEAIAAARRLHVSAYAVFGLARPAARRALDVARAAGVAVSVDAASAAPLAAAGPTTFFDAIGTDLLLVANRDEAEVLTDQAEPGPAVVALARRVGTAVVKLGGSGAMWSDGTEVIHVRTRPVEPLDTTGAGDAFAAALLHALDEGAGPAQALRVAHGVAAEACRVPGGRPPLDAGSSIIGRLV
ncbi:MAG: PfkB family carbohydrate kinase [Actinomycetota bacterium]|nr:PfkB family carbohydrate kinase [Actinomycetota bacterium]